MEEGTVASWLKNVGDEVEEGDILAEIETDKATMEFESFQSGNLLYIGLNEGESAKVDSLLAIIGPEGTDVSNIAKNFKSEGAEAKKETPKAEVKKEVPKAEPKKVEEKKEAPKASGSNTTSTSGRIFASPLAKKMANEKGVDLNQVKGSGENGRIVKKDIENFTPAAQNTSVGKFVATGQEDFDEVPNSNMRKAIAKNLAKSKFTAPHYYLNVEFDMENAIAFRQQYKSIPDTQISYNDMIVESLCFSFKATSHKLTPRGLMKECQ